MIHVDIKRLVRFSSPGHALSGDRKKYKRDDGAGYEYVHVAIDDYPRFAYVEVLEGQKGEHAVAFLRRALRFFTEHGIENIQRVMSDNGSCYKSRCWQKYLKRKQIKHVRTRPYTPRTNGKAERFIQTLLSEWAYVRLYRSSEHRNQVLQRYLYRYNFRRDHSSLGDKPPSTRLV